MSAEGCTASRAWMTSLVLHTAAVFASIVAVLWPAGEQQPIGFPSFDSRAMDVSIVLLAPPAAAPPRILAAPKSMNPPMPLPPAVPPKNADPDIRPASFVEPAGSPTPPAEAQNPELGARTTDIASLPAGAITAFCGVPAVGTSVVFVIDRSASMGLDGRLERARREVAASLERLPPTARFQVIAYHRSPERLAGQGLVRAAADAVATAIAALDRLNPEGGTDHANALRAALALQPDVIYFLTDDDDLTAADVRMVTLLNRSRARIHALCFVEPLGDSSMPALARQNRGVFRVVQ
jgi:hypothetical protein